MLLFKDKINYKLPGANGFAAHLDAPAYTHIGEVEHTNIMMAVNAQTSENGCVELVPGSHKIKVPLANGGRIDSAWESSHEFIPIPLNAGMLRLVFDLPFHVRVAKGCVIPGDFLIFGTVLAHRSGPNPTNKQRAAVFATYHFKSDGTDLREKYYAHRRLFFPPDHGE
jgi:2-aminoethylphosphonate dioxygenase